MADAPRLFDGFEREVLPGGRLSLRPLLDLYGEPTIRAPDAPWHAKRGAVKTLASVLGVERRSIYRWLDNGLSYDQADKFAAKVDMHPVLLWPDQWLAGLEDSA